MTNKPIGEYNFVLKSKDGISKIIFTLVGCEIRHYLSINYLVSITDDTFTGEVDVWIEKEAFNNFVEEYREANAKRTGNINLSSMSPGELEINFISQRMGLYEITYLLNFRSSNLQTNP